MFCINLRISGSEFNCTFLQRFHEPESQRWAAEERWDFILTCCRLKRSSSCSRCCSLSLCSLRHSAPLTFLFNWQASSVCPLTLRFKSPSSPPPVLSPEQKRDRGENWTMWKRNNFMKWYQTHAPTEETVRVQQEPKNEGNWVREIPSFVLKDQLGKCGHRRHEWVTIPFSEFQLSKGATPSIRCARSKNVAGFWPLPLSGCVQVCGCKTSHW